MACQDRGKRSLAVKKSEIERIHKFAFMAERIEPKELAAELLRQWAELKADPPSRVKNWNAYLSDFLHSRSSNWFRDRRTRRSLITSWDEPRTKDSEETGPRQEPSVTADEESRFAFAQAWQELGPKLQRFALTYQELDGNLTAVAIRLRIHRNTASQRRKKVRAIFQEHGIGL